VSVYKLFLDYLLKKNCIEQHFWIIA